MLRLFANKNTLVDSKLAKNLLIFWSKEKEKLREFYFLCDK